MKLSLLTAAIAVALFGCQPSTPVKTPAPPSKVEAAQTLKAKTVALVDDSDPELGVRAFCTGVWVDETHILSARHCMHDGPLGTTIKYVVDSDVFDKGSSVPYDTIVARYGFLSAADDDHDLAMLWAPGAPVGHGVAKVTLDPVLPGQFAQEIGQSLGMWYSYSSGDVSAIRYYDTGEGPMFWVQTTTPTSPGNSGGGLYNEKGELIGICHGTFTRGQLMNIFVHPTYIRPFLATLG